MGQIKVCSLPGSLSLSLPSSLPLPLSLSPRALSNTLSPLTHSVLKTCKFTPLQSLEYPSCRYKTQMLEAKASRLGRGESLHKIMLWIVGDKRCTTTHLWIGRTWTWLSKELSLQKQIRFVEMEIFFVLQQPTGQSGQLYIHTQCKFNFSLLCRANPLPSWNWNCETRRQKGTFVKKSTLDTRKFSDENRKGFFSLFLPNLFSRENVRDDERRFYERKLPIWRVTSASFLLVTAPAIKGPNSLLSSFGRYITNTVLIPIVTLGMTFGTSNCSKHSLVSADYESLRYAEKNLPLLKQGIARGHGMVLTNYLGTFGCQFHETERLTSILQQNYGEIFGPSHSSFEIVSATQNVINSYPNLDGICKTS